MKKQRVLTIWQEIVKQIRDRFTVTAKQIRDRFTITIKLIRDRFTITAKQIRDNSLSIRSVRF